MFTFQREHIKKMKIQAEYININIKCPPSKAVEGSVVSEDYLRKMKLHGVISIH